MIIDMAAVIWNGYKSCMYRTYCVGKKPTREQKDFYHIAYEWLYRAIEKSSARRNHQRDRGMLALSDGTWVIISLAVLAVAGRCETSVGP